nr:CPPV116 hypothetical protein [Cooks petrelpox virus]
MYINIFDVLSRDGKISMLDDETISIVVDKDNNYSLIKSLYDRRRLDKELTERYENNIDTLYKYFFDISENSKYYSIPEIILKAYKTESDINMKLKEIKNLEPNEQHTYVYNLVNEFRNTGSYYMYRLIDKINTIIKSNNTILTDKIDIMFKEAILFRRNI